MKIVIVGGKLQGIEAIYLADKAGMETVLIDKNPVVTSRNLCDRFVCDEVTTDNSNVIEIMKTADFVLPANENIDTLRAVDEICIKHSIPLAFDLNAYEITRSKMKSDQLMHRNDVPSPRYYPDGSAPYIIKPSEGSGSDGVIYAETAEDVECYLKQKENAEASIIQEFVSGPSYSIEVIGIPGNYRTYEITEIHIDRNYDCCKVTAPCDIPEKVQKDFSEIAVKLATLVNLHGIMDVEVIEMNGRLYVLEIDARLPSQTPAVVLQSAGINLLEELADITLNGRFTREKNLSSLKYAVYEHYIKCGNSIVQEGEHSFTSADCLMFKKNFLDSSEAICGMKDGETFTGVFINRADSLDDLEKIRTRVYSNLKEKQEWTDINIQ